jgi:phage protein D
MAEAPLSHNALYAARPVVRVNEQEKERVNGLLQSMDLVEQEDGFSALELKFGNIANKEDGSSEFAFEDESVLKLGDKLTVYAGDENSPTEVFRGVVSALEAVFSEGSPPELIVLAEDALQKTRMARRTKTYENKTLSDIATEIANNIGLTPQITGLTRDLGVQVQMNESDLVFLRRLLARNDGDLQVVGTELHVAPRGQVRRGTVELNMQSQLRRVSVLADLAHQVNEITVTGWDAKQGQKITGRSSGANNGPGQGRTGARILEDSLGRRSHQISHLHVTTDAEANALAEAAFDERQRRFVTVQGTAEGNPNLRVGTHVSLTGLGSRFSNTYYVTKCRHRFDLTRGYETDFTGECAFLGNP